MQSRIRDVRKAKGLTLADVAERCNPQTTAQTIGRLETGMRVLSLIWINRIADALGVDSSDLVALQRSGLLQVRNALQEADRIWNNIEAWTPKPLCKKDCDHMVGNIHEKCAQRGPPLHLTSVRRRWQAQDLYRVPEALIEELFGLLLLRQPASPA